MTEERVYEVDVRGRGDGFGVGQGQSLWRAVNERIAEIAAETAASGPLSILCECADDRCFEQIEIQDSDYAAIRANPRLFVLRPGHMRAAIEQVLGQRDGYVVVERAGETGADPAPPPHPVGARASQDGRKNGASGASNQAVPSPRRLTDGTVRAESWRELQVDALLVELNEARTRIEQLEHALRSRIVLEQAKGILAERFGWSTETAFKVLRSAARSTRMNIHGLANDVVADESTPKPITNTIARSIRRRRTTSADT
jgi:hypothetical protein